VFRWVGGGGGTLLEWGSEKTNGVGGTPRGPWGGLSDMIGTDPGPTRGDGEGGGWEEFASTPADSGGGNEGGQNFFTPRRLPPGGGTDFRALRSK